MPQNVPAGFWWAGMQQLTHENQQKENNNIQQILINNKYDTAIFNKINSKRNQK